MQCSISFILFKMLKSRVYNIAARNAPRDDFNMSNIQDFPDSACTFQYRFFRRPVFKAI